MGSCFGKIQDKELRELEFIGCRFCKLVVQDSRNNRSNLNKHKCCIMFKKHEKTRKVEANGPTKEGMTKLLTEWVVRNCRPYNIVADAGLLNVAEFLLSVGAQFGPDIDANSLLPHPSTIYRNVSELYAIHFDKLKMVLSEAKEAGFAITSDIWTDNYLKSSFICVTAHYVSEGEIFSNLLGLKSTKDLGNNKCK